MEVKACVNCVYYRQFKSYNYRGEGNYWIHNTCSCEQVKTILGHFDLISGRRNFTPYTLYPRLLHATQEERQNHILSNEGG